MSLKWLFLDMNSFFASVEQQENPALRGRPIAVAPVMSDTTCCIAASYEAKAFGIKTGTNIGEAKRLCPHLIIVEARHSPYRQYSEAVVAAVETCTPVHQVWSVDEMVCKLWRNDYHPDNARKLALHIKQTIAKEVGECLRCSIGISLNPFLAKVCSELEKPNGLVIMDDSDMPHALYVLNLRDFPGINRGMEARFNSAGVFSVEQMYALTKEQMKQVFGGVGGEHWWRSLRHEDVVNAPTGRSSFSNSHILAPEFRSAEGATHIAGKLLEKCAERMRYRGFCAKGLSVYMRSTSGETWSRKTRFTPCQDTFTLLGLMRALWEHPFSTPKQVGLALYDVIPAANTTMTLFPEDERRLQAARAVDQINQRFGRTTLSMASVFLHKKEAPDRIAFNHVSEM